MKVAKPGTPRAWLRYRAFCASLFKRDWNIEDYPRILIEQKTADSASRWRADVPGWLGLSGLGSTPEEAISNLAINFKARQAHLVKLPRPGSKFENIELASDERVSADSDLRDKFITEVLEVKAAWISDESSLWDFHFDLDNDIAYARIQEVFGVDVRDIEGALIADILERIKAANHVD
jgi:hypothetical protein